MALAHDTDSNSGAKNGLSSPFTVTWSHTCTGSNLILIVATGGRASAGNSANLPVTGVTYNGVALTKIRSTELDPDSCFRSELWYLIAPATGAHNIVVTYTGALTYCAAAATSLTGAIQSSSAIDSFNGNSDNATTTPNASTTVVAANCWLVDAVYSRSGTLTKDASQTLIAGVTINSDDNVGSSYKVSPGTGSQAMQWTESNDGNTWVVTVASIAPIVTGIKTLDGLAKASVKTIDGLAIASVKTINGLS